MKPKTAVFTVVSNCFSALESTEHTMYDLIIIQRGLPQLDMLAVLKVLRAIGNQTPIVTLERATQGSNRESIQKRLTEGARKIGFAHALIQPYSSKSLCECIEEAIAYGAEQAALDANKRIETEFNLQLETKALEVKSVVESSGTSSSLAKKTKGKAAAKAVVKSAGDQPAAKSTAVASKSKGAKGTAKSAKSEGSAPSLSTTTASMDNGPMANMRKSGRTGSFRIRGNIFEEIEKLGAPKPGEVDRAAGFLAQMSAFAARSPKKQRESHNETEAVDFLTSMASNKQSSSSSSSSK